MNTLDTPRSETTLTGKEPARSSGQQTTRREFLRDSVRFAAGATALIITGSVPRSASAGRWHAGNTVQAYDASVPNAWFDLVRSLIMTNGYSPPVAARAIACAGITVYEALVPGIDYSQSLSGQLNGLTQVEHPPGRAYHWPSVTNSALASMTRKLFPDASGDGLTQIDSLESDFRRQFELVNPPGIVRRSEKWGRDVSAHILQWSKTDGGHGGHREEFPDDGYPVPNGSDGLWEPTPPAYLNALQPFWGTNRPYVLSAANICVPGPPPDFSPDPGTPFYEEAVEVYETVNNLTEEEREIARFWADDPVQTSTPPGHSVSILTQVLEQEDATLALAAEAYARVGIAVNDAFVSCWNTKYTYNLLRPITYIHRYIDEDWGFPESDTPLPVVTPPFPEFTSGHSVQSGATATVLSALFGDQYAFVDHTHVERGREPRPFASFDEYAREAAISRLYGGIHFRSAIDLGLHEGECVGKAVNALIMKV